MNALRKVFAGHSDLVLVVLVVGVLVVLFAPIPAGLLDFLILTNISFALLILLLTFYMDKPVEFSTFPSVLLVATLFRLSLNIAATRLILRDAHAGRVIDAIGAYVVGGNYVIGLIVFLILVVVQYVVVTSGAQRVSEVAARFTLDSMPGQQMSIDADLNMGFIDQAEAQRRRKNLGKEAGFYGAMDGASKFVKGDAIAGIVIMLINVVGGLVIGMMQMGMPWAEALQRYTLLTIGDGIVTQVPALIISVGTGLIVTRSAADANLSREVLHQLTAFPKTLLLVVAALGGLLFLPGLPAMPLLALIGIFATVGILRRHAGASEEGAAGAEPAAADEDAYAALDIEPIEVLLGVSLVPVIGADQAMFRQRLATFRKQYAMEAGLVLPGVRFHDAARLAPDAYEICVFGVAVARGEIHQDRTLAIHPGGEVKKLRGIETREPTYGLPAVWIADEERDKARLAKFTLVDPATVFVTHLCEVLRQQSANLLTRKETEQLIGRVRQRQPGLVEDVVPAVLSVSDIQKVLQNLLKEKVSVRNLEAIIETLADHGKATRDPAVLTELVRQRLGAVICQSLLGGQGALQVLTLDPAIEHSLMQSIRAAEAGGPLVIEPKFAEQVLARLGQQAEKMMKGNLVPVLLCSPELRRHVRALAERMLPHLRVVAHHEIPGGFELRAFGTVAL
ncbi:flagellar biosynthesis protein FlhA [Massilia endophytica]|uniref:flagellar biosynthesis protein FlhA n=1 Tax=Massilia endophytica TaxID=2899220 RepID=UPI001E406F1E|nr:flagellar biosynthesis protein FlhA [Massilia endophytica]UGQ47958.1 flagellar biosynthesis protein FlhA [Massilia endophytica]